MARTVTSTGIRSVAGMRHSNSSDENSNWLYRREGHSKNNDEKSDWLNMEGGA